MVENRQKTKNTLHTFCFREMYGRIPTLMVRPEPIINLYHTQEFDIFVW